jgi:cob(I)alamin adenosyltransferase
MFTTQEIIDNQTALKSIERELYDLCESIAYDVIDESQHDLVESNLKILQDALEEEEEIAGEIQRYLKLKGK